MVLSFKMRRAEAWFLLAGALSAAVQAQNLATRDPLMKPAWEVGVGLGMTALPDYRGAESSQTLVIPTPYFVYRSSEMAVAGSGVKARLFGSDRLTLDASFDFALGTVLKANQARVGMPKLPATLSLGPQISYLLWANDNDRNRLYARLPARQAFALGDSQHNAGVVVEPHLKADFRDLSFAKGWEIEAEFGPNWGNRRRHQLYYSVDPQYALASRPSYLADSGYGGLQASLTATRRFGSWYAGGYLRYDSVRGAVFEPSPLIRRKDNISIVFGVSYVFAESDRRVAVLR